VVGRLRETLHERIPEMGAFEGKLMAGGEISPDPAHKGMLCSRFGRIDRNKVLQSDWGTVLYWGSVGGQRTIRPRTAECAKHCDDAKSSHASFSNDQPNPLCTIIGPKVLEKSGEHIQNSRFLVANRSSSDLEYRDLAPTRPLAQPKATQKSETRMSKTHTRAEMEPHSHCLVHLDFGP
jgi:hypothetical protein